MVNLLRVPGEQQVMLMVTVAEVNRTAARTIGMDFSVVNGRFAMLQGTGGLLTTASVASSAAQALTNVGGNLPTAIDNGNVLMAIQALRTLNFARSLAEPNLTTLNGKPANFQAGGSFPIPTSIVTPGGAAQSVTYQNFGVALQFVPYITDRDRIRLQLNASVSTPAITTTQVSGANVPSQIAQRQFSTTVELREGQTLTVAGLIQNNFSGTSKRIPLWGDLPIIGRTGGNDSLTSGEQELVVLVTPLLVHPLDMCKTPALPGSDVFEPGDIEFYLLGHLEGRRSQDYRASVRTDFARQERYIHCNDMYIIGSHGTTYGCCKPQRPVPGTMPKSLSGSGDQWQQLASRITTRSTSNTRCSVEDGFHVPSKSNFATFGIFLIVFVVTAICGCHTCNDIVPGAIPQPNGTYACQWAHAEKARADQDKFVIYQYEWSTDATQLTPYGQQHLAQIAQGLPQVPFPVVIEPSSDNRINELRRVTVFNALASNGTQVTPDRVIFGRTEAEGL